MQRDSSPRFWISIPEGKITLFLTMVAVLWQASHWTVVPMGAGALTTFGSLPSAPT